MAQTEHGYAQFWLDYLGEHRRRGNRVLHYCGTGTALMLLLAAAVVGSPGLAVAAVVTGYGCAWLGHALFEHNRPATFRHPLWSLACDFRLCALVVSGRLGAELERVTHHPRGKNG